MYSRKNFISLTEWISFKAHKFTKVCKLRNDVSKFSAYEYRTNVTRPHITFFIIIFLFDNDNKCVIKIVNP